MIGGLLLFNATLGFIQEGRAGAALAALKKRLAPTALVRRDGEWIRLPASELVPGDAIRLSLGALVPADATIASGSVMVDQSMLTGESVPVDAEPGSNIYASSLVRRGQAIADVTATGSKTYFGRTAELVRIAQAGSTEQAAIFGATRNLAIINGAVAVLIIASAYFMALPSPDLIRLALTALLATIPRGAAGNVHAVGRIRRADPCRTWRAFNPSVRRARGRRDGCPVRRQDGHLDAECAGSRRRRRNAGVRSGARAGACGIGKLGG